MQQDKQSNDQESSIFQDNLVQYDNSLPEWQDSSIIQKFKIIGYHTLVYMPLVIVYSFIVIIWTTFIYFYIIPLIADVHDTPEIFFWHSSEEQKDARIKGYILLGIQSFLSAIFGISLFRAIYTHPGKIPNDQTWLVASEADSFSLQYQQNQAEKKRDGSSRICYICSKYKPDRSHHCRLCGECVLKMDHHCPWIANCVGFYNYKYFFLTINYAMLVLGIYCGTFWEAVVVNLNNDENQQIVQLTILMIYTSACLLEIGLIGFVTFHWYLITNNYSTVEYCEKKDRRQVYKYGSPYFISVSSNMKQALGNYWWLWCVPFGAYREDTDNGTSFAIEDRAFD